MSLIRKNEIRVSNGVCFIVSDKARVPYIMFLDRTVHKTVGSILFNCRNKKAI